MFKQIIRCHIRVDSFQRPRRFTFFSCFTKVTQCHVFVSQNDILGPAGFGGAHFIPPDLNLEYTIRFENDPNATAPAQRVFIRHEFDDDLDPRTFRIGSFGFGNFTKDLPLTRAFIQVDI